MTGLANPPFPLLEDMEKGRVQCDGCSARAAIAVYLPYGVLAFCNHHYNKHADSLTEQGGVAKLLGISEEEQGLNG